MNIAIPEQYRLLNICLVDVGAGTSDICITKDGSIVAYGMIPLAGDEITEKLQRIILLTSTQRRLLRYPQAIRTIKRLCSMILWDLNRGLLQARYRQ